MTDSICTEVLFNTVEQELARRWACHNVPPVFINRPVLHLRLIVKLWWHLYHESVCASRQTDRTIWQQEPSDECLMMNSRELADGLVTIYSRINVAALLNFRPVLESERVALTLLTMTIAYYQASTTQHFTRWLQIL